MTDLSPEENIDIMIAVMSDVNVHLEACRGYKRTGTTNAFDSTGDHLIKREAEVFWKERHMREKIDAELRSWRQSGMQNCYIGAIRRCIRSSANTRDVAS